MVPRTENCLTCLKEFAKTDMAVQLNCVDGANNVSVLTKLITCIPEITICTPMDELCTTCNYMLGICYKFHTMCLDSQQKLSRTREPDRKPNLADHDPVKAIEEDPSLSDAEKNRRILAQILKLNPHLGQYKPEDFECEVKLEPLPKFQAVKEQEERNVSTWCLCQCNHCGLTFTSKVKLLAHIRRHFNYKPHKCELCERSYFEVDDLRMHMMAHEVEEKRRKRESSTPGDSGELSVKRMKITEERREIKSSGIAEEKQIAKGMQTSKKTNEVRKNNRIEEIATAGLNGANEEMPDLIPVVDIKTEKEDVVVDVEVDPLGLYDPSEVVNSSSSLASSGLALGASGGPETGIGPSSKSGSGIGGSKIKYNASNESGLSINGSNMWINGASNRSGPAISDASGSHRIRIGPPGRVQFPPEAEALNGANTTQMSMQNKGRPMYNPAAVNFIEKYITNFRCRFCHILFQTDLETQQHAELHCRICLTLCDHPGAHDHLHPMLLNRNKKETFMCLECGTHNPRGHFILHHKVHDIICEICSAAFATDKLYQHHRLSCPEYRCKYCDKTFPTLNHGRTHEYHTHEKRMRGDLRCPKCNKQFPMTKLLKIHACEKCETCEEFVDVKHKKRHVCNPPLQDYQPGLLEMMLTVQQPEEVDSKAGIRLLTPEELANNSFRCEVCSKSFENKPMLDGHECYDDEGNRVYRCQICTGYFSRLEFIDHMKLHID